MRRMAIGIVSLIALACTSIPVHAQSWRPPDDAQRCPSKWGAGDERGSANHMKPAAVLKATNLIKSGEVIDLAHVLSAAGPFFGTRRFDVHTKRTFMNPQSNRRGSNEELLISEIGQVGTQLDGFTHQTIGDGLYNCFKVSEISSRGGFTKMGIEKVVHQIMLAVNGIHILENMKLDELAGKRVHEFAFIMQPMKLQGFTGSTVTPIAVR